MSIKQVFLSRIPACAYLLKNGIKVEFINGKYLTDDKEIVAELEQEVKAGHPLIYRDANNLEVDTELQQRALEAAMKAASEVLQGAPDTDGTITNELLKQVGAASTAQLDPNPLPSISKGSLPAALLANRKK